MKRGTRVSDRSEAIMYDTSSIGDKFGWTEETRGLDLRLLDTEDNIVWAEERLGDIESQLTELKERGSKQRHVVETWVGHKGPAFDYELNKLYKLRDRYTSLKKSCDGLRDYIANQAAYDPHVEQADDPDDSTQDYDIPLHWKQAKDYWDRIYDFICQNDLPEHHLKRLFFKVREAKKQKSISSYYYVHISYHCAQKLGLKKDIARLAKFAAKCRENAYPGSMWNKLPNKETSPLMVSFDDRFSASISIDIEDVVDKMAYYRALGRAKNMSPQEAYCFAEDQVLLRTPEWYVKYYD